MENRKYFNQEGKEAKNFYHLSDDGGETHRHPPKRPPIRPRSIQSHASQQHKSSTKPGPRVRSASTGRDKKSELQARYWALLFGNLQRSVNEIYQTVECYENLSSCMEAILVLENYIRDFKALAEWFKVSWDYEATPLPQRPHSLAWEVRKSNPAPRVRKQLSSPGMSGKSSPSFSGKNSPCPATEEQGRTCSPKKAHSSTESLSKKGQIKRADGKELSIQSTEAVSVVYHCTPIETYVLKLDQYTQTNLDDENLTLAEYLEKYSKQHCNGNRASELMSEEEANKDTARVESDPSTVDKVDEKKPYLMSEPKGEPSVRKCPVKNTSVSYMGVTKTPTVRAALQTKLTTVPKAVGVRGTGVRPPGPTGIVRKSATASSLSHSHLKPSVNLPIKSATVSSLSSSTMQSVGMRNGVKQSYPLKSAIGPPVVSNVVASRLAVRSKTMIEVTSVGRIKDLAATDPRRRSTAKLSLAGNLSKEEMYSSSSTLKASTDRLGSRNSISSCSTSRATGTPRQQPASTQAKAASRRSEPKTMPSSDSTNNDGWYTVKTKRRSSLLWATRFNQPSGYASLPTLALLDENANNTVADEEPLPQKETEKMTESESESNQPQRVPRMLEKPTRPPPHSKSALSKANGLSTVSTEITQPFNQLRTTLAPGAKNRQSTAPVSRGSDSRQKSDLTGLKLKTLHKEFLRSEKLKSKNATELLPTASGSLVNGQSENDVASTNVHNVDNLTHWNMVDMNIQTNLGTTAIESLYATCLQESPEAIKDPIGSIEQPSQCTSDDQEEHERDDMESDEDQRKLLEEQESLEAQIRELENTEIDFDTETDETDCEAIIDFEDTDGTVESGADRQSDISGVPGDDEEDITLEMRYEAVLAEMNWVERARTLDTLKALVARHPGRAQQLHAKLSSPSRRRSLHETLKKYQAKQTRALEKRQALQKEKAFKIQQLLTRVEDVKAAKQCLIEKKRLRMEERLQRAAENRTQYLKDKIKKAHDEEEKLKEIAFIKNLEAQNKRLDFMESWKEQEGRLQDLETERQKKAEEKAAKEAAVERRRQEIEQERQKKLQQMSENRREREKRVGKMQEQKERQRQALAREKARDREERLLALQAQKQATTEELQRKIIQKQQESARRHEENIEQIRQRAVELATIPSRGMDELRNEEHDEENSSISERDSLNGGAGGGGVGPMPRINKKKVKKLRQKLSTAAEEYLAELTPLAPSIRKQSQVPRLLNTVAKGGSGTLGVERPIGQLLRLIAKAEVADFQSLWLLDGLNTISAVIESGLSPGTDVSRKAVVLSVQLYRNACTLCPQIARHAVLGNTIVVLLNALLLALQMPEEKNPLFPVELSTELILACTVALLPTSPSPKQATHPKVAERLPDLLSYIVSIGLVDTLVRRINSVHESIENQTSRVLSLLASLGLLTKLVEICPKGPDVTKLLQTAHSTELFGTVSLLYAAIVPVGESIPPRTTSLAAATFNLLVTFANLDIEAFQAVLSERNLSLRFLDVISILLQYCVPKADIKSETQTVIIDLIATLGFFCANNKTNQDLLTSEQHTFVIKNFAKLPNQFDVITYPTLVTIIHENPSARSVVARDFNVELLDEFKRSDMAKKNRIVSLLI